MCSSRTHHLVERQHQSNAKMTYNLGNAHFVPVLKIHDIILSTSQIIIAALPCVYFQDTRNIVINDLKFEKYCYSAHITD